MPTGVYERRKIECAHPGCSVAVLGSSKLGLCRRHYTVAWKKANAESVNAHNRRYNAAHPEQARASSDKWNAANPASRADRAAIRRARKRHQFVERVYRAKVFARDDGVCGVCSGRVDPGNWHLDHITPLALGGEHRYANVQVTHPSCNLTKGAKAA